MRELSGHSALVRLLEEEPRREKTADEFFAPNEVRAHAASALGGIGAEPEQTVRLLTKTLKHSDPEIRIWSAIGLGRMGEKAKAAIPALAACLADEKMILKPGGCLWSAHPDHAAATALVDISPSSIPALIAALDAREARVRRHAANALWHCGEAARPAVERAAPSLAGSGRGSAFLSLQHAGLDRARCQAVRARDCPSDP